LPERPENPSTAAARGGAAALAALVALAFLLVLITASRAGFLTPTATADYFPSWMAGPLGGLWRPGWAGALGPQRLVSVVLAAMYLAYVAVLALSASVRARPLLAAVLGVHLSFLLAPPLQYTDVFNYINYGRMGVVHHLNPYVVVPWLEPRGDPAFALSNWHGLVSPYGPLFTLATYALVPLGVAASFWVFKALICAASLGVLALVWRCARLLGRDPVRAVALVGLNPIVLLWSLGADHNDLLMVLPAMAGVYLLLRSRVSAEESARAGAAESVRAGASAPAGAAGSESVRTGESRPARASALLRPEHFAGAALVVAAGVKASAVVLIPVAFAAARRRGAFAAGAASAAAATAAVSVVAFGPRLPGFGIQTRLVTDLGPANLLGWLLGLGGESDALRTVLAVVAGAAVLLCAARARRPGRDWIELAGIALLVVWLTTSWFTPWYVVWLLPFAALAGRRRLEFCLLGIGLYLLVAFGPEVTPLLHSLHFNPYGSPLGERHFRQITMLLH
jgi:hypothetical protein